MAKRRYHNKNKDDELERGLSGLLVLGILILIIYFFKNPEKIIPYTIVIIVIVFAFYYLRKNWREKHLNNLLEKLRSSGQEDYLKNFINRFGLEGGKGPGYEFRNHKFEWDRIEDFKNIMKEKGVTSKVRDIKTLINFYIQKKEENFTRGGILKDPQKFVNLTGPDFERLLWRLFEAIGFKVEIIGRTGDQGGDLIAIKDGERFLIQAKAYNNSSTGNDSVQQVVAAMKYYDCTKAMVITTSRFTSEAVVLAKKNEIELVSKNHLQELLLKNLGESWL
ncbi:MAG: restriction endonuclease [Candidatus Jorgensenbacteria bacterium]|nr:restriction endonuclease [Candidatus Jorgensenbacteria bacterium]